MAKKEKNKEKNKNNFAKDLKAELKKVTWPTFKKLVNNTFAVISIVLIVSVIVFVLDVCFENLNKFGVENLKSVVSSEEQKNDGDEQNQTEETTGEENFEGIDLVPEENADGNNEGESDTEMDLEAQTNNNSEEVTQ